MSHKHKLKAFGVGLLAMMAMGAFVVINASAETGGHFTSDSLTGNTLIVGTEGPNEAHRTELSVFQLAGIVCDEASYSATPTGGTVTSVTVTPTYAKCKTTGGSPGEVTVDMNGCQYVLTIGKKSTGHNTVDLVCNGATKFVAVTHPSCQIRIPASNNIVGVSYNTTLETKHSITLQATATGFTAHFESGFCVLLGTSKFAHLNGSVTVKGFEEPSGNQVNITATGSEG